MVNISYFSDEKMPAPIKYLLPGFLLLILVELDAQSLQTVIQRGHSEPIRSIDLSADGQLLLTGSRDKSAKLWDVASGHELRSFLGHAYTVNHVLFSTQMNLIATTSTDNTARLWDLMTGQEIFKYTAEEFVTDALFAQQDELLITGGYDDWVIIWDYRNNRPLDSIKVNAPQMGVGLDLAISDDGKWLAIGEDNQRARIFKTSDWTAVYDYPIESGFCGNCFTLVTFSPDSRRFIKLAHNGRLNQYDLQTGKLISSWGTEWEDITSVNYNSNGESILVSTEKEVLLLKTEKGDTLFRFQPEVGLVNQALFGPGGDEILVAGDDGKVSAFAIEDQQLSRTYEGILNQVDKGGLSYDPSSYWDSFIARYVKLKNNQLLSRDGHLLIRGKFGNKAKAWEINTGRSVTEFSGHEKTILGLDQSRDGQWILTGGGDRVANLWNAQSGEIVKSFSGHTNLLFESRFSHDQKKIITTGWDARVNIWDIEREERLTLIDFQNTSGYTISFTPNDLYFVVGKLDKTLEMWETDTRSVVRKFIGHTDVVSQILFLDANRMITTSWDGSARVWNIASGLMDQKFSTNAPLYAAVLTPDQKMLVTGGVDRSIRFWNLQTGQLEMSLPGHKAAVTNLIFRNDAETLISTDLDGITKFWNFKTGTELFEHVHIGTGDWMVKTKDGYFSATDGAREVIHFVEGLTSYELDQFFDEFYRPELIQDLLLGKSNRNLKGLSNQLADSPPPSVKIVALPNEDETTAEIMVRVEDVGGGAKDLKLFHNGKRLNLMAKDWTILNKEGSRTDYGTEIALVGGVNIFASSASSEGNIESKQAVTEVRSSLTSNAATLHIFVVGINQYKNEKMSLNYARNDAEAIGGLLSNRGSTLFDKVKIHELYDENASKSTILGTLERLASEVRVHDVFVFYYAGHGSVVDNRFYFIPVESTRLYDSKSLAQSAIDAGAIQERLEKIQALKQIIIMDACQSGGSVELLAQRGALEEKAIAQLSRSAGIHVLAAAGSDQFATEFQHLGHGVFTYVLLEALGGKADGAPKDGKVTIYELKSYLDDQVPEQSQRHKGKPQYPYTFSRGNDFPVILFEN